MTPPAKTETPSPKKSRAPHPKVAAGTLSGACTVLIVWVVGLTGVTLPADVSAAITVIIYFLIAYLTPSA